MKYLYFFKISDKIRPSALLIMLLFSSFNFYGQWTQVGQDIDGSTQENYIGFTQDISEDGNTIAYKYFNTSTIETIKIMQYNGTSWAQKGQSIGFSFDDDPLDLSISSDGNILAVGISQNDFNGNLHGYVNIYNFNGSSWILGSSIQNPNNSIEDLFGAKLRLSASGDRLAISSQIDNIFGPESLIIRMYDFQQNQWVQVGNTINSVFGNSDPNDNFALSGNGEKLAVQNSLAQPGNSNGVNVFSLQNNTWTPETITGYEPDGYRCFGCGLDINFDGTTIVIGSYFEQTNGNGSGAARVFSNTTGSWTQKGSTIFGDNLESVGWVVSIDNTGNRIVTSTSEVQKIKAYQFTNNWSLLGAPINVNNQTGSGELTEGSLSGNGNRILAFDSNFVVNGQQSGQAKVYEFDFQTPPPPEPQTFVPDDNYENYLETHSANGNVVTLGDLTSMGNGIANDDYVFTSRIENVSTLSVPSLNIADLTGIEDFTAVTFINFTDNLLTSVDISNNLNLTGFNASINNLSSLDVTNLTELNAFDANFNQLTTIDTSNNSELIGIFIENNFLNNLDFTNNSLLQVVVVNNNNLPNINVSNTPMLESLQIGGNNLTNINLSQNEMLTTLLINDNLLTSLDLSNSINLNYIQCFNNNLNTINLQNGNNQAITNNIQNGVINSYTSFGNPNLTCIFVDNAADSSMNWTQIDPNSTFVETQAECDDLSSPSGLTFVPDDNFEQRLQALGYDSGPLDDYVLTANINTLTTIDLAGFNITDLTGIEDFVALTELLVDGNQIPTVNLSNNTQLQNLQFNNNVLTQLDLSANTQLTQLNVSDNSFIALVVSANTLLESLTVTENLISQLDVDTLTQLSFLAINNTDISTINLANNTLLTTLWTSNTNLTTLDVTNNVNLQEYTGNFLNLTTLDFRNGNNTAITQFEATNNPVLTCVFVDDAAYSTTNWTNIDATTTFVETQAECDDLGVAIDNCENIEQPFIQTPITIFNYGIGPNVETADDIDVPAQINFNLTTIETLFSHPGSLMGAVPLQSTTIRFYSDDNGVPGVLIDEITNIAPIATTEIALPLGAINYFAHTFDISAENITLSGGNTGTKFWMVFTDTVTINGEPGISWTATVLQNGETGKQKLTSQTGWGEINNNDEFDLVYSLEFDCEIITCNQPQVDTLTNIESCDPYTLPSLTNGNYFTETNGGGTPLFAGDIITNNQTIYVYAVDPNDATCTNESSFTVTFPQGVSAICQDFILNLDASGNATLLPENIDNGSQADCGMVALSINVSNFTCDNIGENMVTLTVTDDNGNQNTCSATVTVVDTLPPTIECNDITIDLNVNGEATIIPTDVFVTSNDNCEIDNYTLSQNTFTCADLGDNSIDVTVFDIYGNATTCTSIVTVNATGSPNAVCQNITISLDSDGEAIITAMDIDNGSEDSCGFQDLIYSIDQDFFDCSSIGENTITLTVTQPNGTSDTCDANVTIVDTTAPLAFCQNITLELDENGNATTSVMEVGALSTDNCEIQEITISQQNFTCDDLGQNTVTLTVIDTSGNVATCDALITITDTLSPAVSCQDLTLPILANGATATITPADLITAVTDNCQIATTTISMDTFSCENVGLNTVTITVIDASGNAAICEAIVTVEDIESPVASCQNITLELDENGAATLAATDINNGSTDNCEIVTMTIDVDQFTCEDLGDNIVNFQTIDASGNENNCTALVTVIQYQGAPQANCNNVTAVINQNGLSTITGEQLSNNSTGLSCNPTYELDINTFTCNEVGMIIPVTLTITNENGLSSTCISQVHIVDSLSPEMSCPEEPLVIASIAPYQLPDFVENGTVTVSDNCESQLQIIQEPQPSSFVEAGFTEITITVTDPSGNSVACEFDIFVDPTLNTTTNELTTSKIKLFPNPAKDVVSISTSEIKSINIISVVDISGRTVKEVAIDNVTEILSINISELSAATYFVIIKSDNAVYAGQLIKY